MVFHFSVFEHCKINSATFRVQGSGLFFLVFFLFLICFFDFSTSIAARFLVTKKLFLSRVGRGRGEKGKGEWCTFWRPLFFSFFVFFWMDFL